VEIGAQALVGPSY